MSKMCKGKTVNTMCPIMGTKLDPSKVTASLTRTYNGKKIGFCCAGCPIAWDKLSAEEKAKKIAEPIPAVKAKHESHSGKKQDHGH